MKKTPFYIFVNTFVLVVTVLWVTGLAKADTHSHSSVNSLNISAMDRSLIDVETDLHSAVGITTRVSVASDGTQGNDSSGYSGPSISADGRYVAFESHATNLVSGDTNGQMDIFVHDWLTGQTSRVSISSDGIQGSGLEPSISADGRYVSFHSSNAMVNGDTNSVFDVYVHDRQTGQTSRISVASDGMQGNDVSYSESISADGRYVTFSSKANNLVSGDTNNELDVFVHDRQTGQTSRVSVASDGTQGDDFSEGSSISADGRYVAFNSYANNLVDEDYGYGRDVFIHDRQTGQTNLISTTFNETPGGGYSPSISSSGRYVAFESDGSMLVSGDTNNAPDIFVYDQLTGQISRVSVNSNGIQGNTGSYTPSISGDGRYVTFYSWANNLVSGDTNVAHDIFVHDRLTGQTSRVSVTTDEIQGNGLSSRPSISGDGRYVAFFSEANNLVSGDTNGYRDVFVHDRCPDESCVPAPTPLLSIESIDLAHISISSGEWITTNSTYDGNVVQITAQIRNIDDFDGPALVNFINNETGEIVGSKIQSSFPVGQITPVSYEWYTSGEAWQEDGSPQTLPIPIKVAVSDLVDSNVVDEEIVPLLIKPKPVILVHGLWSDASTWQSYDTFLQDTNPEWYAYAVNSMNTGDWAHPSLPSNTIAENAYELYIYIQTVRETLDAWQVDIVAHSMGGLISRHYIQNFMTYDGRPVVSRLLMLGTPNGGSVCADIISTISPSAWNPVMHQLRTDYLPIFNMEIIQRWGVEFAILAGNAYQYPCSLPEGDGVVSVNSALAIPITDNTSRTANFHDEMTGSLENFTLFVQPRLTNNFSNSLFEETQMQEGNQVRQGIFSNPQLTYGEVIDILPLETQVIQLPQLGGSQLQVLLTNVSTINANLRDPANVIVDSVTAHSDEANQIFVSLLADSVTSGTYVLELTNMDTEAKSVSVGVWVEDDPAQLELLVTNLDEPNQGMLSRDQVQILATFTNGGSPVVGADLMTQIVAESGEEMTITLFDDGNHEDGQANDGMYGNIFEYLAPNTYIFRVQAEGDGITRLTSSLVKIAPYQTFLPVVIQ